MLKLADPTRRFLAFVLDGLLIAVTYAVAASFFPLYDTDSFHHKPLHPIPHVIHLVGLPFLYEALLISWRGQTLGKMLLGIQVASTTGQKLGIVRACGRAFLRWGFALPLIVMPIVLGNSESGFFASLSSLPALADHALLLYNPRSLHDFLAGTLVVRKNA